MKTSLNLETVAFFSVLPDIIFILDAKDRISYANPAALHCCEAPLSKILGTALDQWIQIVVTGRNGRKAEERWDNGMPTLERHGLLRSGENQVPVFFTSATVAQQTIVRARRVSGSETLAAAEKQRQVSMLSQNHNRGQARFAMSLVHELSQPLCSAVLEANFADRVAKELGKADLAGAEDLQRSITELQKLHQGMEKTLSKVRDFATRGEEEIWEPCDPPTIVSEVLEQIRFSFEAENMVINVDGQKSIPKIFVGRNRLKRVLAALLESILESCRQSKQAAAGTANRGLSIAFKAEADKWVSFQIFPIFCKSFVRQDIAGESVDMLKLQWLELDMLNACVCSMGGEMMLMRAADQQISIKFRLPAHLEEERSQLIALIDMLHSEEQQVP